jgi:hypothetical protein
MKQTFETSEQTIQALTTLRLAEEKEHTTPLPRRKHLVSKGEYVANVGKKAALSSSGASLYFLGLLGLTMLLTFFVLGDARDWEVPLVMVFMSGLALVSLGTAYVGRRTLRKAVKLDAGIPFTHANTADLPAPESLVRASEEPMQEQQAVLLRAATQTQERHEEQLVRAAGGLE